MVGLNAKQLPSGGGDFKRPDPMEAGTYPARTVLIATLGVQPQRPYQGEDKPPKLELLVTYEMLDEFMKDDDGNDLKDKPRWLTETFPFNNLEQEKAKSTKRYFALDPKGEVDGDWSLLDNIPCMVTVVVNEGKGKNAGKFYEQVSNVSAMRPKEADKAPPLVNAPVVFDFYHPDKEAYDALPNWIKNKMTEAVDYEGSAVAAFGPVEDGPRKAPAIAAKDEPADDEIPW